MMSELFAKYQFGVILRTTNEQIFRNPHALRPCILFNFFSVLPNYSDEQIQNLSFLLLIVFQLNLFSWHMVGPVSDQKSRMV